MLDPRALLRFLGVVEKLKCNTRHSWTSTGRHETVAAHSWRLSTLAFLIRHEFEALDMDRVIAMCLVHDFGEAVTGDIPSFEKSGADEAREESAVDGMLDLLPQRERAECRALFAEMREQRTKEARLFRALDKLEAVLQHNEAPLSTWLPLEYELQRTYGVLEAQEFPLLKALREEMLRDTEAKTSAETAAQETNTENVS